MNKIDSSVDNKIIHRYQNEGISVVIEMPKENDSQCKDLMDDIRDIMNNELLLQINRQ